MIKDMSNFEQINDVNHLNRIFEGAQDKLVILMFYTKNNPDCRKAQTYFERIAMNNPLSHFCVIDTDRFKGESRFVKNMNNMPRFDCYYFGNMIGSYSTSNEKEIEQIIRSGQQYVMMQNNLKNNSGNIQYNQTSMVGQVNPLQSQTQQMQNCLQMQNQLQPQPYQTLNGLQMQNPLHYQFPPQNPQVLHQMSQRQMANQTLTQQVFSPQTSTPQQVFSSQTSTPQQVFSPQTSTPQQVFSPQTSTPLQTFTNVPIMGQSTIPMVSPSHQFTNFNPGITNIDTATNQLPTLQQMQQMFQIFQMMQQIGILNTSPVQITDNITQKDDIIVLPNGDKIIPLSNGKYGLVRKPN
jgi:thiol-disulfide isomerase/thioredoxin